jgi:CheY-like chemotaxis protein
LEGHAVEAVYDPHEAVAITPIFSPHVVFLDIGLPEMNGYEVARRLRDAGIRAHLVALTGYGQHEDIARAMRAGFDKHLVKPVDLDKLKAVLRGVEPSANAS